MQHLLKLRQHQILQMRSAANIANNQQVQLLVRVEGLEPTLPIGKRIFLPTTAFAARQIDPVCGLDYLFALMRLHFRRRPFSLYTFLASQAWLGIAI